MKPTHRRHFLGYAGTAVATSWLGGCTRDVAPPTCPEAGAAARPDGPAAGSQRAPSLVEAVDGAPRERGPNRRTQVVFFDAFPIFDPRPVFKLVGELFPEVGPALVEEWRMRQFEYQWLRAVSRRYKDFWHVTEDALSFACAKLGQELTEEKRVRLMNAYLTLPVWPDVPSALERLRAKGLELAFLSNMTEAMLRSNAKAAGIEQHFRAFLSTDARQTYKPHPDAYALGLDTFGIQHHQAVFVAFAGWDSAGAKWFGYPTFWNNRTNAQSEQLDADADATGPSLDALLSFLES